MAIGEDGRRDTTTMADSEIRRAKIGQSRRNG